MPWLKPAFAGILVPVLLSACADGLSASEWDMQASATAGTALVFNEGEADEVRIACRRGPAEIYVRPVGFMAAPGDAPLHLRAGAEAIALDVLAIPGGSKAIEAKGPLTPGFFTFMESGQPIHLEYAGQRRALPAPNAQLRTDFTRACRQAT